METNLCGYVGRFALAGQVKSLGDDSVGQIIHRGPSELGSTSSEVLKIAFARLSIIDIDGGQQPFIDSSTGAVAVVNGEIYNHESLRLELENLGYQFETGSDCEVVLWGYLAWGLGIFTRLRGMFACTIVSGKKIIFSRDRLGKKPLYWRRLEDEILFSSEVPGILGQVGQCVPKHAGEYFASDSVSWNGSCNCGVTSVPPGTAVELTRQSVSTNAYWSLPAAVKKLRESVDSKHLLDLYEKQLHESVAERLMSDVPIGLFLSDGLDSQLVAAISHRMGQVQTAYTLRFEEDSFDESLRAKRFADTIGLSHEVVPAGIEDLAEIWELFRTAIDEPFADSAILGEMLLARAAQGKTPVVLTGDGGDESFLGYQHVRAHEALEQPALRGFLRTMSPVLEYVSRLEHRGYFSAPFVAERLLRGLGENDFVSRDLRWRVSLDEKRANEILSSSARESFYRTRRDLVSAYSHNSEFLDWRDKWGLLYAQGYLRDIILRKVDRATMRFGVEARSPLLDADCFATALAMRPRDRSGIGGNKIPIRQLLRKSVPNWMPSGRKHGMGIPLGKLLAGPLAADVGEALGPQSPLLEFGIANQEGLEKLSLEFRANPSQMSREVWAILIFSRWVSR